MPQGNNYIRLFKCMMMLFSCLLMPHCASEQKFIGASKAEIDRITITFQFARQEPRGIFDTTISITSEPEIITLINIFGKKDKLRLCRAHSNIQYLIKNKEIFNADFSMACKFIQLYYKVKLFDRRLISVEGMSLLEKYKNEILKSIGPEWVVL